METSKIKKILWNSFWLSLLFHLLLLAYFFYMMTTPTPPSDTKTSDLAKRYVPAYTYTGSIKPRKQQQAVKKQQQTARKQPQTEEVVQTQLPAQHNPEDIPVPEHRPPKHSSAALLADAFNLMQEEQLQSVSEQGEPDPIYLVGDDSQPSDPLIRLIGQSLSKHFEYPPTAGRLGIKGKVLVKLTLHPDGYYSDVQIIQSSHNQDLDAAALYAVNAAPQVFGADRFISKPKRIVIGFIFN